MSASNRILASLLLSFAVGAFLFYFAIDIAIFVVDRIHVALVPRRWQEILFHTLWLVLFGTPIAALAQRNSAVFGALAALVGDLLMFFYWLQASPPRAQFGIGYFAVSVLYAGFFALSSHMWWVYAFKRRVAPSAG